MARESPILACFGLCLVCQTPPIGTLCRITSIGTGIFSASTVSNGEQEEYRPATNGIFGRHEVNSSK